MISTNADEAGAPRHVESIVNGLQSDFQFVLMFGENGPVSDRLKRRGHSVHVVEEMRTSINPFKDLIAFIKLAKLIRACQPDIIHCHSAKAGMLGRLLAFTYRIQWIYTVHGWGWRGVSSFTSKIIIFVEKILSKLPRGYYIFVAQDVMKDASDILKLKTLKGAVVYNGVPPFHSAESANPTPLVVVMPARVSSAKDHKTLISAFELLNDENMRLVLCGTGTDDVGFIEFAKKLAPNNIKHIEFLGQRSDIEDIFSRAHIVTLISNFEALPLSIIEAMSCSKAIIASDVGGVPELIENGVSGVLVARGCIEDTTEALRRCRDEEVRIAFGRQANITYKQHFTDEVMTSSIFEIYRSLASCSK